MNEEQVRVNAAMAELKAHNDWLVNRCINMAAELVVLKQKLDEATKDAAITNPQ
jgi:hypothetical protein